MTEQELWSQERYQESENSKNISSESQFREKWKKRREKVEKQKSDTAKIDEVRQKIQEFKKPVVLPSTDLREKPLPPPEQRKFNPFGILADIKRQKKEALDKLQK